MVRCPDPAAVVREEPIEILTESAAQPVRQDDLRDLPEEDPGTMDLSLYMMPGKGAAQCRAQFAQASRLYSVLEYEPPVTRDQKAVRE